MSTDTKAVKRHLLKSAGIVSAMTLLSRVLGMVRDIVNANMFGISRVWDAFVFAFMIPNFLRRLLGEGALSGAFIPIYTEILNTKGTKEANYFTNIIMSLLIVGLGSVLILINLIIAVLMHVCTFSARVQLILGLLQFFFPYILMLCVLAVVIAVLNCHKKFFVPSLMPIVLNIGWIITLVFVCARFGGSYEEKVYLLAGGIFCIGVVQFVMQFIALYRTGFRFRFNLDVKDKFVSKLVWLMMPALLGFSVTQINILIDLFLAFLIGEGASSSLWYGNRLMQFPLGMFGIAMGTVLLPTIAKQASQKLFGQMKETLSFSLRVVILIIVPSTVGLIVLSRPVVSLLFQSGLFDAVATDKASGTLMAYSLGLFAYSGIKLLLSSFYALQDTKTPVKIGVICMIMNIVLNVILMTFMREVGIALSTSISNTINFIVLYVLLEKRIGHVRGIIAPFVKVVLASILMGCVVTVFFNTLQVTCFPLAKLNLCLRILVSIMGGIISYGIFCVLLRVREVKQVWIFCGDIMRERAQRAAQKQEV